MSSETPDPTPSPNRLFQPTSPDSEPFWYTVPNERSTFDLVCSCVLTLLMCVWTAIHLNIPKYKERKRGSIWPYLWRRIWWMFIGLIWPELVLFSAWSQFIQARLICVRLNKMEERWAREEEKSAKENLGEKVNTSTITLADYASDSDYEDDIELARKKSTNLSASTTLLPTHSTETGTSAAHDVPTQLSAWQRIKHSINPGELERGYYGVMGGFEIVIGQDPKKGGEVRRTLTPCGIILLSRMGLLPTISIESINDKSKADLLTKALVCVQGLWMLIQGIGRKIEGLPLTLLELNTIMHVGCALIMYFLWLKKPQDVGVPTRIDDKHPSKPLGALLSIEQVHTGTDEQGVASIIEAAEKDAGVLQWNNGQFTYKPPGSDKYEVIWGFGATATYTPGTIPNDSTEAIKVRYFWINSTPRPTPEYNLTFRAEDTYLTPLSAQFLVDYSSGTIPIFGKSPSVSINWETFTTEITHNGNFGCTKRAGNLELKGSIKSSKSEFAGWTAVILFPAIYGGIHLTPWSAHFPTHLERYLWRFSGLYVAVGVPALGILYGLMNGVLDTINPFKVPFRAVKVFWRRFKPSSESGFLTKVLVYPVLVNIMIPVLFALLFAFGIALFIMTILYPLTRLYILVEAFASLRSLPKGAYKTVGWSEMFPHF